MAWKFCQSHLTQWTTGLRGGSASHVTKRNVIRLVEHSSGIRVVRITGGNSNINNGVSTNFDHS